MLLPGNEFMATRTSGRVAGGLWVIFIACAAGAGCQSLELPGGTADFRRDSQQLAQSVKSPFAAPAAERPDGNGAAQIARASSPSPDQLPPPHWNESSAAGHAQVRSASHRGLN